MKRSVLCWGRHSDWFDILQGSDRVEFCPLCSTYALLMTGYIYSLVVIAVLE